MDSSSEVWFPTTRLTRAQVTSRQGLGWGSWQEGKVEVRFGKSRVKKRASPVVGNLGTFCVDDKEFEWFCFIFLPSLPPSPLPVSRLLWGEDSFHTRIHCQKFPRRSISNVVIQRILSSTQRNTVSKTLLFVSLSPFLLRVSCPPPTPRSRTATKT